MTDIVERLRACQGVLTHDPECNCTEAADEIERLRNEIEARKTAVEKVYLEQVNEIERLHKVLAIEGLSCKVAADIERQRAEIERLCEVRESEGNEIERLQKDKTQIAEVAARLEAELYAVLSERNVQAAEIERLRALSLDNMPKNENEWWIALKDQNREIERLQVENEKFRTAIRVAVKALEPFPPTAKKHELLL